jgi:hypothetical protein
VSEPDDFLTRWSRRKREVEAAEGKAKTPAAEDAVARKEHEGASAPATPAAADAQPAKPEFDLSRLPPIEEITADTNISAFLNPAVPETLRREALRRLWSLNPPTQEALLMAEYAGDFTDAGNMAGFGPLQMTDELRQLARQIVGGVPDAPQESAPEPAHAMDREDVIDDQSTAVTVPVRHAAGEEISSPVTGRPRVTSAVESEPKATEQDLTAKADSPQRDKNFGAAQQPDHSSEGSRSTGRPSVPRGHGRALPQ